jgi:Predicted membrane protein/domain
MQANETAEPVAQELNTSDGTLESSRDTTSETRYADFWLRGIAALIEACVFMALSIPVCFILPFFISQIDANTLIPPLPPLFFIEGLVPEISFPLFMAYLKEFNTEAGLTQATPLIWSSVLGGVLLINLLYHSIMESSPFQATIGKLVVGLKVKDAHGQRISFLRALSRNLLRIPSTVPLCLGYFMAAKTKARQTLHDKFSGTFVEKELLSGKEF